MKCRKTQWMYQWKLLKMINTMISPSDGTIHTYLTILQYHEHKCMKAVYIKWQWIKQDNGDYTTTNIRTSWWEVWYTKAYVIDQLFYDSWKWMIIQFVWYEFSYKSWWLVRLYDWPCKCSIVLIIVSIRLYLCFCTILIDVVCIDFVRKYVKIENTVCTIISFWSVSGRVFLEDSYERGEGDTRMGWHFGIYAQTQTSITQKHTRRKERNTWLGTFHHTIWLS